MGVVQGGAMGCASGRGCGGVVRECYGVWLREEGLWVWFSEGSGGVVQGDIILLPFEGEHDCTW